MGDFEGREAVVVALPEVSAWGGWARRRQLPTVALGSVETATTKVGRRMRRPHETVDLLGRRKA